MLVDLFDLIEGEGAIHRNRDTFFQQQNLNIKQMETFSCFDLIQKFNLKVVWMKLWRPFLQQDPIFCRVILVCVIHILEKVHI